MQILFSSLLEFVAGGSGNQPAAIVDMILICLCRTLLPEQNCDTEKHHNWVKVSEVRLLLWLKPKSSFPFSDPLLHRLLDRTFTDWSLSFFYLLSKFWTCSCFSVSHSQDVVLRMCQYLITKRRCCDVTSSRNSFSLMFMKNDKDNKHVKHLLNLKEMKQKLLCRFSALGFCEVLFLHCQLTGPE